MNSSNPKVILIAGAYGNVGQALTQRFAQSKQLLILAGRDHEKLKVLGQTLSCSQDHRLLFSLDLADDTKVAKMCEDVVKIWGRIDALIHTAGGFRTARVHETSLETWDFLMNGNVRSLFCLARHVIPHMIQKKEGCVIHIASQAALLGKARMGVYAASKSAVLRLTESMAAELKPFGISVNCFLPNTLDTPENRKQMPTLDRSQWLSPHALAEMIETLVFEDPTRRITGSSILC